MRLSRMAGGPKSMVRRHSDQRDVEHSPDGVRQRLDPVDRDVCRLQVPCSRAGRCGGRYAGSRFDPTRVATDEKPPTRHKGERASGAARNPKVRFNPEAPDLVVGVQAAHVDGDRRYLPHPANRLMAIRSHRLSHACKS